MRGAWALVTAWRQRKPALAPGLASLLVVTTLAASCGYALVGRGNSLPDRIRRIGIPQFENLSQTPELDRILTEAIRTEFASRRRFSIVPETEGVDAVLKGSIRSVTSEIAAVTGNTRLASSVFIHVLVSAEFTESNAPPTSPINWSNAALRLTEEYETGGGSAGADVATLFAQDRNALERIARKLAQSIVAAVLENF